MEFAPYILLALGLVMFFGAFWLHGRAERKTIERRVRGLRRYREER